MGTQTTDSVIPSDFSVAYSLTGTGSWTEFCGFATNVRQTGGELRTGEKFTACGDRPIIGFGKFNSYKLAIDLVYTEKDADPYLQLLNYFQNKTQLAFRWSPKGGGADAKMYRTSLGRLTNVPLPSVDASSSDPIMATVEFICTDIYDESVAS